MPSSNQRLSKAGGEAKKTLVRVIEKLKGMDRLLGSGSQTLGVEGHTRRLINEAQNEKKLSQMYWGWRAYF